MGASLFAIITLCLLQLSYADNLYPKCAGAEYDKHVAANTGNVKLLDFPSKGTKLLGSCFAFDISAVNKEACKVEHQTDLLVRIFLRAKDDNNNVVDFDIDDIIGGSASNLTFSTTSPSTFSMYAKNLHHDADCLLQLRYVATTRFIPETSVDSKYAAPSLVKVSPVTVFTHNEDMSYFVFRMQDQPKDSDKVTLVPTGVPCNSSNAMSMVRTNDAKAEKLIAEYEHRDLHTTWKHYFEEDGVFHICYKHNNAPIEIIGTLFVYSSNPRYYDIIEGGGERGEIYLYTDITIRFYGTNLDTRPDGDAAKLVNMKENCKTGEPAGGVNLATDLSPADDWGPNTTFSDWKLNIKEPGEYTICYKRSDGPWSAIAYLYDVNPAGQEQLVASTAAPIPTNPENKLPCPTITSTVQVEKQRILDDHSVLQLTIDSNTVPKYFIDLLAQSLCVPTISIVVYGKVENKQGHSDVFITVQCPIGYCSGAERMTFLRWAVENSHASVRELKVLDVTLVSSLTAWKNTSSHKWLYICGTLIILAAIGAGVYLYHRRSQHVFIQFGVDEDDDAHDITNQENDSIRGVATQNP